MTAQQPPATRPALSKRLLEIVKIIVTRHLTMHHQATFVALAKAIRAAKQAGSIIIANRQIDDAITALITSGDLIQASDGTIVLPPSPIPAALLARVNEVLWAHLKAAGYSSFKTLVDVVLSAKQAGTIDIDDQQIEPAIRHLLASEVLVGIEDGFISHENHHVIVKGKRYLIDEIGYLDLSNQGLHDLAEIEGLDRVAGILKELDLSHNHLSNIDALAPCTKLERLDISHNQVTNIDTITNFPRLCEINVNDNQITHIPPPSTFKRLEKLLRFYAGGNKISWLPPLDEFITIGPEGEGRQFGFGNNLITDITINHDIVVGYLGLQGNKVTDAVWIWKVWLYQGDESSPFDCLTVDPNPFSPDAKKDVARYFDKVMANERGYGNMPRES